MLPRRTLLAILCASMTFGCAVGPDYRRPDAPLQAHYVQSQGHVGHGQVVSNAGQDAWWESFNDPLLVSLVNTALDQNLDIAQASARMAQAKAGVGAAEAALQPIGAVSASAARAQQSLEDQMGRVLSQNPKYDRWGNAYTANLSASWELDVFGGLKRETEAAVADYQASQAGVAATRLVVEAQVADIYILIRGLQARLDIAKQQVQTQQGLLAKVTLLYQRGVAAENQVHQSEAALAQAQAAVPVLQAGLDSAMNALDVMLGTPPGTNRDKLAAATPIPLPPQIASVGSPSDLLERRPDLIVAERKLVALNAQVGEAISEYYPKFSLGALIGSATTIASRNLFTDKSSQMAGVLGLRWRLFDFNRIDAEIKVAKGRQSEGLAAYRQAVLRATEDVESATSAMVNREEQSAVLSRGEASLIRARASAEAAHRHGAASEIDVLHADAVVLTMADARAQAQTESARTAVALFKALGGGWQDQPAHVLSVASELDSNSHLGSRE